ncbi:hypothetical protein HKX48_006620, partial [Thoreauomyces humboldtii]
HEDARDINSRLRPYPYPIPGTTTTDTSPTEADQSILESRESNLASTFVIDAPHRSRTFSKTNLHHHPTSTSLFDEHPQILPDGNKELESPRPTPPTFTLGIHLTSIASEKDDGPSSLLPLDRQSSREDGPDNLIRITNAAGKVVTKPVEDHQVHATPTPAVVVDVPGAKATSEPRPAAGNGVGDINPFTITPGGAFGIPPALEGSDGAAGSGTGSGNTASFGPSRSPPVPPSPPSPPVPPAGAGGAAAADGGGVAGANAGTTAPVGTVNGETNQDESVSAANSLTVSAGTPNAATGSTVGTVAAAAAGGAGAAPAAAAVQPPAVAVPGISAGQPVTAPVSDTVGVSAAGSANTPSTGVVSSAAGATMGGAVAAGIAGMSGVPTSDSPLAGALSSAIGAAAEAVAAAAGVSVASAANVAGATVAGAPTTGAAATPGTVGTGGVVANANSGTGSGTAAASGGTTTTGVSGQVSYPKGPTGKPNDSSSSGTTSAPHAAAPGSPVVTGTGGGGTADPSDPSRSASSTAGSQTGHWENKYSGGVVAAAGCLIAFVVGLVIVYRRRNGGSLALPSRLRRKKRPYVRQSDDHDEDGRGSGREMAIKTNSLDTDGYVSTTVPVMGGSGVLLDSFAPGYHPPPISGFFTANHMSATTKPLVPLPVPALVVTLSSPPPPTSELDITDSMPTPLTPSASSAILRSIEEDEDDEIRTLSVPATVPSSSSSSLVDVKGRKIHARAEKGHRSSGSSSSGSSLYEDLTTALLALRFLPHQLRPGRQAAGSATRFSDATTVTTTTSGGSSSSTTTTTVSTNGGKRGRDRERERDRGRRVLSVSGSSESSFFSSSGTEGARRSVGSGCTASTGSVGGDGWTMEGSGGSDIDVGSVVEVRFV